MQGSSGRNHCHITAGAKTSAFSLQPSALIRGVRHRANAGGPIPNPSLAPAPLLFLLLLLLITGCASAPTRLEQKLFDIRTNQVPTTVLVTNIVPVYAAPNAANHPITGSTTSWRTNVTLTTNLVEVYTYS